MLYDGDTFERGGHTFRVHFPDDDNNEAPWDRSEGHGTIRNVYGHHGVQDIRKAPGEVVMFQDRGAYWLYDLAGTLRTARKDGWGLSDTDKAHLSHRLGRAPTKREIAAESVRLDMEFCGGWLRDQWTYIGVVVTLLDEDGDATDHEESIWGVESCERDYLTETAHEQADMILAALHDESAECEWSAVRNIATVES